jgi:pyridoxine kinase
MNTPKRVAAIHDLSGFGRCSLTVIIPILSAMGVQVCPVPTAILSTHTGGFDNMVFRDLTDYISESYEHYRSLGIEFDAVYSGFLASSAQIDCCLRFFRGYKNALKTVDPVMGDNGKPYKTYTPELCARMNELVRVADIITPNLTEAAILLGEDYRTDKAVEWVKRLCELAPTVIITGAVIDGSYCNIGYDGKQLVRCDYEHIPAHFPGTGDIFTSVLTGAILEGGKGGKMGERGKMGENIQSALTRATEFAREAVRVTHAAGGGAEAHRNGVMLEGLLKSL